MDALVSVIIPNYNQEKYVGETIESILGQTYQNFELILVDDGSTDQSLKILREYEKKSDKITVLTQENMNASVARNRGIENAKGDYFYFMDSDDTMYPEALELLVKAAVKYDADLVIGNMDEFIDDHKIVATDIFFKEEGCSDKHTDFLTTLPAVPNKLYKASVARENHVIFGNVRIGQDTNFFLKFLCCAKKVAFIPQLIFSWRLLPTSVTHAMDYHIFDITNSFANTRKFYELSGRGQEYTDYVRMIEYHTYYRQMDKQVSFATREERKTVIAYFCFYLKRLGDVSTCKNYDQYENAVKKCRLKMRLRWLYATKLFAKFYSVKNK